MNEPFIATRISSENSAWQEDASATACAALWPRRGDDGATENSARQEDTSAYFVRGSFAAHARKLFNPFLGTSWQLNPSLRKPIERIAICRR